MFGITRLTVEEKTEYTRIKRIKELEGLINKESLTREASLEKASLYSKELDTLTK